MSLRAVLGVLALLIGWAGFSNRWNSDDAFINFRIVDNLLAGHGPVYNVGERVEAGTSTLWLGILAAGALLPGPLEWFAVLAGLAMTVAGVVWGGLAAARIHAEPGERGRWVPFGLLLFVAVPPAWHFATSGLETGLTFAWLGGSYLALTRAVLATTRVMRRDLPLAVLLGLGPLIRPDLAVFSAAFLAVWFVVHRSRGAAWVVRAGVTAVALPVVYQVFRMGYYGSLVPNTALAKEASGSRLEQGATYLADFAGAYLLLLPLAVVAVVAYARWRATGRWSPKGLLILAPVAGALAHAAFVVKVGGDFMHGRLLLPALFALALPAAVLPFRRDDSRVTVPFAVVATWAVVAALGLRPDYFGSDVIPPDNGGIADEHGFYVTFTGEEHPVTLEQHAGGGFMAAATAVEDHLENGLSYVNPSPLTMYAPGGLVPRPEPGYEIVTTYPTIGVFGYSLGPQVAVVDALGLADPLAARTALPPDRSGRIGHEKSLHPAWVVARFAGNAPADDPEVAAASAALECGAVARLERAVSSPLDWRLFVNNVVASAELTALRLPGLPSEVAREQCP